MSQLQKGRFSLKACAALLLAVIPLVFVPVPAHAFSNILTVEPDPSSAPVGSGIVVSVVVRDFQPLDGVDISLQYDATPGILNAVSMDFEGSIMLVGSYPPNVVVNCVNGSSWYCGPGTVRMAASILGALTSATNGPLFNIHFNVVGSGTTALHIFNDDIANPSLVLHTTVDGSFTSGPAPPSPDFFLTAPAFVEMPLGIVYSKTVPIVVLGTDGFEGTLNVNASISSNAANHPTLQLNSRTVMLQPDQNATVLLTVTITGKTAPDHYLVTVSGSSDVTTHSIPIDVMVLAWLPGAVQATVFLNPSIVQPSSQRYLTVFIELPRGFDPSRIDLATVKVNYQVGIANQSSGRIGDRNQNGLPDLTVRFVLADVLSTFPLAYPGGNTIIVTGVLTGAIVPEFYGLAELLLK